MRLKTWVGAKLHRIRVTEAKVDYVGSVSMAEDFMDQVGIEINEQVQIVDLENGHRWVTYAIPTPRGSRTMSLNDGGALLGRGGDKLVVMTFVKSPEKVVPQVLFFGNNNVVLKVGTTEPHRTIHPDLQSEVS